jgi:hypothetical protein
VTVGRAIFDRYIVADNKPGLLETLQEGRQKVRAFVDRSKAEIADDRRRSPLRACRKRPHNHAA